MKFARKTSPTAPLKARRRRQTPIHSRRQARHPLAEMPPAQPPERPLPPPVSSPEAGSDETPWNMDTGVPPPASAHMPSGDLAAPTATVPVPQPSPIQQLPHSAAESIRAAEDALRARSRPIAYVTQDEFDRLLEVISELTDAQLRFEESAAPNSRLEALERKVELALQQMHNNRGGPA